MAAPDRRVAVIALDSAEWTLLEQLMADGEMPRLRELRERSAVALLDNPDYRTGLVWEHFLTGRDAAGCGRVAAVEFDPRTYAVWQEGARPLTPFFATDPALRSIVFDVPYVSLGVDAPGTIVTGWGGHDPGYPPAAQPAGLEREIEAHFGFNPASGNDYEVVWNRPAHIDALADALVAGAARRADIAAWLQAREPDWELFVTVMSEPHSVNEALWHGIDDGAPVAAAGTRERAGRRLRDVYRAVDASLGRMLDALPKGTDVVVFSMHGSARNDADVASMVLLPELLYRLYSGNNGAFLRQPDGDAWARAGRPVIVPDTSWYEYMAAAFASDGPPPPRTWRQRVPAPLRAAYKRLRGTAPARVGALGRPVPAPTDQAPDEIGVLHTSVDWQVASRYQQFWPTMRAFAMPTFYDGRVRLNVRGRERDGVVAPEDYERVLDEVIAAVGACRDPRTGAPVLAEAIRLEGADADLQLIWSHETDAWEHPDAGLIGPFPYRRTGGHSRRGFAFISGDDIAPGDLGAHAALDVTPTILALLDRDPPAPMHGAPLLPRRPRTARAAPQTDDAAR